MVVTDNSELTQIWKEWWFKAYDDETLIDLMCSLEEMVPEYVRINRTYRDIPASQILHWSTLSNLRQIVENRMKERWIKLQDIRNREIKDKINDPSWAVLHTFKYEASGWTEYFMTFEDKEDRTIFSLLRLRLPNLVDSEHIKECKTTEEYEKLFEFFHTMWKDEFDKDIIKRKESFLKAKIFYIEKNWVLVSALQLEKLTEEIIEKENMHQYAKAWNYMLWRIWTLKEHRKEWYATILINKSLDYLSEIWQKKVLLSAEIKSVHFYKKFWFETFWDFSSTWNTKSIHMQLDLIQGRFLPPQEWQNSFLPELSWSALIREIHTFWDQLSIWETWSTFGQHIGFWKRLIAEAEKIAKENGYKKLAVIAWVWVREYYKKRWYELDWEYMVKSL